MKIDKIDQVAIPVSNIQNSIEFYNEVLKLDIIEEDTHSAILKADNCSIKLPSSKSKDKFKPSNFEQGTVEVSLTTIRNINTIVTHLGVQGILLLEGPIEEKTHDGIVQSVYFRDPDNNLIRILSKNLVDLKEVKELH